MKTPTLAERFASRPPVLRAVWICSAFLLLISSDTKAQGLINFDASRLFYGGSSYVESGVRLTGGTMSTWSGQYSNTPTNQSPYLAYKYSGIISIVLTNGQPFGLTSVELANPAVSTLPISITFKGYKADGSRITNMFTTPGNETKTFGYYPFSSGFIAGLTNVEVSGPFAMDNLEVVTGRTPPPLLPTPVPLQLEFITNQILTPVALLAADFNGDSKADIALSANKKVGFYYGKGDGSFADPAEYPAGTNTYNVLMTADFNNDGRADLVGNVRGYNDTTLYLSHASGVGTITKIAAQAIAVGDFNNDGKADIAFTPLSVTLGNGDGTFRSPIYTPNESLNYYYGVAVGDFNGDGFSDLAGSDSILVNQGDSTFSRWNNSGGKPILGDFNNDGHLDMTVFNSFGLTVRLSNGKWFWNQIRYLGYSSDYKAPGTAADFNGDGNLDLILHMRSYVYIFLGNGDGSFVITDLPIPSGSYVPSIDTADFNGDGRPDVALTAYSNFTIMLNRTPPTVRLSPKAGYNQISWPSVFARAFALEYSTNFSDTSSWQPFPYPPVLIGRENAVADWADAPQTFYRLRKTSR